MRGGTLVSDGAGVVKSIDRVAGLLDYWIIADYWSPVVRNGGRFEHLTRSLVLAALALVRCARVLVYRPEMLCVRTILVALWHLCIEWHRVECI